MTQKYLSIRIKELRQQHNLTQQQLADLLSVSNKAVSKWENDEGTPDLDNLKRLAQVFNVTIDSLVNLTPVASTKSLLDDTNRIYVIFIVLGLAASFLTILQVNPLVFAQSVYEIGSSDYWDFIEPFSHFTSSFRWINLKFYHVFSYLFSKFNIYLLVYILAQIYWFAVNIAILKNILEDNLNKRIIYILLGLDVLIILSIILLTLMTDYFKLGLASFAFTVCHIIMLYLVEPSKQKNFEVNES